MSPFAPRKIRYFRGAKGNKSGDNPPTVPANAKNIKYIRDFLDHRASLGWTDLPRAFSQAFQHAGRNTSIVYVGDGIPTTGDGRSGRDRRGSCVGCIKRNALESRL